MIRSPLFAQACKVQKTKDKKEDWFFLPLPERKQKTITGILFSSHVQIQSKRKHSNRQTKKKTGFFLLSMQLSFLYFLYIFFIFFFLVFLTGFQKKEREKRQITTRSNTSVSVCSSFFFLLPIHPTPFPRSLSFFLCFLFSCAFFASDDGNGMGVCSFLVRRRFLWE